MYKNVGNEGDRDNQDRIKRSMFCGDNTKCRHYNIRRPEINKKISYVRGEIQTL